ncbi:MAG: hypothetical protein HYZ35_07275 [Chloroflexi bacterium]|nr:hypothetical protein [Chloroflexota bacterium]
MNSLSFVIGSVAVVVGIAIVVLPLRFLRTNRTKNSITGVVFVLIGASIIWLNLQGNVTYHINIGISDEQFGFLLPSFVLSLFILKGVLDIREGSEKLRTKSLSPFLIFSSRFQIIVAIIITTFAVVCWFVVLSSFLRNSE